MFIEYFVEVTATLQLRNTKQSFLRIVNLTSWSFSFWPKATIFKSNSPLTLSKMNFSKKSQKLTKINAFNWPHPRPQKILNLVDVVGHFVRQVSISFMLDFFANILVTKNCKAKRF